MAMIENIRKRRGLLIFLIGLGMIMFLIPYDAVMGLFGGTPGSESMGEFNGSSLTRASYQNMVQKFGNSQLYNTDQAAESAAWNNFAQQTVYGPEIENAAYQVGPEEFQNIMFGANISDWAKQVYYRNQDPTPQTVQETENYFDGFDGRLSPSGRAVQTELITFEYNKQKLEKLIKTGFYANTLDAEREFLNKEDKVNIDVVAVKYASISDSLVNVTDGDVRSYYNKHKNDLEFKQKPFREVTLAKYDVVATAEDSTLIKNSLAKLEDKWKNSSSNDSTFLVNEGFGYSEQAYKPGTLAGKFDTLLVNSSTGTIIGPYVDNGAFKFSKIVRKDKIVSEAKGRHIFLPASLNEKDSIKIIADSLKQLLIDGGDFSRLASKWSQDDSTSTSGGNLGWIKVEELNNPGITGGQVKKLITAAKKGETNVASVGGGFSIYQATDFKYDGVESVLVSMDQSIEASKATRDAQFAIVRELPLNYSNGAELLDHLSDEGKSVEVKKINQTASKRAVPGITNSERISGWAYRPSTDLNDISEVISVGNDFYIAVLTKVQDDEIPEFSVVEDKMREGALKQAKFDYVSKKMTTGDLANASLEDIKNGIEGAEKRVALIRGNSSNISGVGGNEAIAVGSALGTPEGKISAPIKGQDAVILYEVKTITYADLKTNYAEEQGKLQTKYEGLATRVRTTAQNNLVKDLRFKF